MPKDQETAKPREGDLAKGGGDQIDAAAPDRRDVMEMVRKQKANVVELQRRIRRRVKNEMDIRNQAKFVAEEQKRLAPLLQEGDRVMTLEVLESDILDTLGAAANVVAGININIKNIKDLLSDLPTMAEIGVAAGTRSRQGQVNNEPPNAGVQRTSTMNPRGRGRGRGRGRLEYSPPLQELEEEEEEMATPRGDMEAESVDEREEAKRGDNIDWLTSSGVLTDAADNPVLKLIEEQNRSRNRREPMPPMGTHTQERGKKKKHKTTLSQSRPYLAQSDVGSDIQELSALDSQKRRVFFQSMSERSSAYGWPEGWQMPNDRERDEHFTKKNINRVLKDGIIKTFSGESGEYFGFKNAFYTEIHVQDALISTKINALESLISDEVKRKIFPTTMGLSEKEYKFRLERLELYYGGAKNMMDHIATKIEKLTKHAPDDPEDLLELICTAEEFTILMGSNQQEGYLMTQIERSLPEEMLMEYHYHLRKTKQKETLSGMIEFVKPLALARRDVSRIVAVKRRTRSAKPTETTKVRAESFKFSSGRGEIARKPTLTQDSDSSELEEESCNFTQKNLKPCYCGELHAVYTCDDFFQLTPYEKRVWITKKGFCEICLNYGHPTSKCQNKHRCRWCKDGLHNQLLHLNKKMYKKWKKDQEAEDTEAEDRAMINLAHASSYTARITQEKGEGHHAFTTKGKSLIDGNPYPYAVQILPIKVKDEDGKNEINIYALADPGATHVFASDRVARRLKVEGKMVELKVSGHGGVEENFKAIKTKLRISALNGGIEREVEAQCYPNPCGDLVASDWSVLKEQWKHLRHIPAPAPLNDRRVDMIIGTMQADMMEAVAPVVFGKPGEPTAKLTQLGWIFSGRTIPDREKRESLPEKAKVFHARLVSRSDELKGCPDDWMEGPLERKSEFIDCNLTHKERLVEHGMVYATTQQKIPDYHGKQTVKTEHLRTEQAEGNKGWIQEMFKEWEIENVAVRRMLRNCHSPKPVTTKEKEAIERFHSRVRMENGRYSVPLLWKSDDRPENNFDIAKNMFERYEKRLAEDCVLREQYFRAIQDWLDKDYAYVTREDPRQGFYLPTFMVVRLDKSTTKYRLIMNGAAKFGKHKRSINDFLLTGPNFINGVFEVFAKYRRGKYTLSCDISQMFLNIMTTPEDHEYVQILMRRNASDPWMVIRCNRHIFGLTQSPYVAIQTVLYHLYQRRQDWPEVWNAFPEHAVVDDFMFSTDHKSKIQELYRQIVPAFQSMGMAVHKWATNNEELWKQMPKDVRQETLIVREEEDLTFCIDGDGTPIIKALGILHHTKSDTLQFYPPEKIKGRWTQRLFASFVGKIFDPLGLISPVMTMGRRISQLMFRQNKSWDDEVSKEAQEAIELWCKSLAELPKIQIPRCLYDGIPPEFIEYVVCTDASSKAMAACIYQRVWRGEGQWQSRLICSKLKMNPISKPESIPRVETEAANVGVKLACQLAKTYRLDMERFTFFTDSTTVLWYLRSRNDMPIFTANRVCQILDYTELDQWNYIYTKDNPADTPTRGMRPKKLRYCELWWKGPKFFEKNREDWPPQPGIFQTADAKAEEIPTRELLSNVCLLSHAEREEKFRISNEWLPMMVGRTSDIQRGVRVAAIVERFINRVLNCKAGLGTGRCNISFTQQDRKRSEEAIWTRIIKNDQRLTMPELIGALMGKGKYANAYLEYRPTLGSDGIIRCYGRLRNVPTYHKLTSDPNQLQRVLLPDTAIRPILLAKTSPLAREILRHHHEKELRHCGSPATLLAETKMRFIIVGGMKLAKEVCKNCPHCKKVRNWTPKSVATAGLHPNRVGLGFRPFAEMNVDMAGPFNVRHGKTRASIKVYAILFVCSATRAINIEICEDASAKSCMFAFQRHTARYGTPSIVYTDNGTNFKGAERMVREQFLL